MTDLIAKLNSALKAKPKSGGHTANFRHENEEAILEAAKKLLAKSEHGQSLLEFAAEAKIEMHVLRNKQDFGYLPEQSTVYITCPAGQDMPGARAVIHLAGALRQAYQEVSGKIPAPNVDMGRERFAKQIVDKQRDYTIYQTAVVYDIVQRTGLLEIVDEFDRMGYRSLYEAYCRDKAKGTEKEEKN